MYNVFIKIYAYLWKIFFYKNTNFVGKKLLLLEIRKLA